MSDTTYNRMFQAFGNIREVADRYNDPDEQRSAGELQTQWERVNDDYDLLARSPESRSFSIDDVPARGSAMPALSPGEDAFKRTLALQGWLRGQHELELTNAQERACRSLGIDPRKDKALDISIGESSVMFGHQGWCERGNMKGIEPRALGVVAPGTGGETVPEGFVYELEKAMVAWNGPRQVARIMRTATGNQLRWPTVDDTNNEGERIAENVSIGNSVDPVFGEKVFGAYKYSSTPILVAQELLEDTGLPNFAGDIGEMLGQRIGRKTARDFTFGNGISEPEGLDTATPVGITAATPTSFAADDFTDLPHTVDYHYRNAGRALGYMMHDLIMRDLRKLKDGRGQYLWQPSLRAGTPDQFNGYPLVMNQQMASAPVAGATVAFFGDFAKFIIRDAAELRLYRLNERYRAADQVGFVALSRQDSKLIQPGAMRKLVQP